MEVRQRFGGGRSWEELGGIIRNVINAERETLEELEHNNQIVLY